MSRHLLRFRLRSTLFRAENEVDEATEIDLSKNVQLNGNEKKNIRAIKVGNLCSTGW